MEQVKTFAGTALLGLIALSGLLWKAVLGILDLWLGDEVREEDMEEHSFDNYYERMESEYERSLSDEEYINGW